MPRKSNTPNPYKAASKFRGRRRQAQRLVDLAEVSGDTASDSKGAVDEARRLLGGEKVRLRQGSNTAKKLSGVLRRRLKNSPKAPQ